MKTGQAQVCPKCHLQVAQRLSQEKVMMRMEQISPEFVLTAENSLCSWDSVGTAGLRDNQGDHFSWIERRDK